MLCCSAPWQHPVIFRPMALTTLPVPVTLVLPEWQSIYSGQQKNGTLSQAYKCFNRPQHSGTCRLHTSPHCRTSILPPTAFACVLLPLSQQTAAVDAVVSPSLLTSSFVLWTKDWISNWSDNCHCGEAGLKHGRGLERFLGKKWRWNKFLGKCWGLHMSASFHTFIASEKGSEQNLRDLEKSNAVSGVWSAPDRTQFWQNPARWNFINVFSFTWGHL